MNTLIDWIDNLSDSHFALLLIGEFCVVFSVLSVLRWVLS